MTNLLAGHALSPGGRVVVRLVEVGIVELGIARRNVTVGINGDSGNTQPARITVSEITDADLSARSATTASRLV